MRFVSHECQSTAFYAAFVSNPLAAYSAEATTKRDTDLAYQPNAQVLYFQSNKVLFSKDSCVQST